MPVEKIYFQNSKLLRPKGIESTILWETVERQCLPARKEIAEMEKSRLK